MAKPKLKTIDVFANPWHAIDHDGVPQAVVQYPGTRNYIGARIDHAHSIASESTRFYFSGEKVTVPLTPETARAVNEGALIAADKKQAAWCGISEKEFLDPKEALEREKAKALAAWKAHLGDDAVLQDVPSALAAPPAADASAPVETPKGTRVAHNVTLQTEG